MTEAWIIDAARTPRGIGKINKGALTTIHPQRILSTVLKALGERNNLITEEVDDGFRSVVSVERCTFRVSFYFGRSASSRT